MSKAHRQGVGARKVLDTITTDKKLAAEVPAKVQKNGLRITTSPGYPPMEMFDDDGTSIIGVDPSLGRAIGKVLGVKVTVHREDFNAQIPGLLTGR